MDDKKQKTENLYKAVLCLENENECKRFLRDLLTDSEIKEFSNRWKAAQLLDQKVPYETIEKLTGMSSTTVARIAKWLNGEIGGYRLVIDKIKK